MLQNMIAIQNSLKDSRNTYMTQTNTINDELVELNSKIKKQNDQITSNNLTSDVLQEMVNYTYEKNSYSSNLLALYGGLNIVAIALLVYIYRS